MSKKSWDEFGPPRRLAILVSIVSCLLFGVAGVTMWIVGLWWNATYLSPPEVDLAFALTGFVFLFIAAAAGILAAGLWDLG